jgi:hypothetical protein
MQPNIVLKVRGMDDKTTLGEPSATWTFKQTLKWAGLADKGHSSRHAGNAVMSGGTGGQRLQGP